MKRILTLYLVFIFVSFIGFIYETLLAFIMNFSSLDRGFLSLPFCPIYGFGVIITYLFFNTPFNLKILNNNIVVNKKNKIYLYIILSAILASIIEVLVGYFFEYFFDKVLWTYSFVLTFNKYCSLLPSLFWGISITLFMYFIFPKLYRYIYRFKITNLFTITIVTLLFIFIDLINLIF